MYVSGRPDWKISRTDLAARLSTLFLPDPFSIIFIKTIPSGKKSEAAPLLLRNTLM
jgi:hypothetical protein